MSMHVTCPCGRLLALAPEHAGRLVRCPVCRQTFVAGGQATQVRTDPAGAAARAPDPGPDSQTYALADEPEDAGPAHAAPRSAPPAARPAEGRDDPPRRPRRRTAAPGSRRVLRAVADFLGHPFAFRAVIAMAIAGVGLLVVGLQESRLADLASERPQKMTLAQLEANGPGGNAHVVVTDFIPARNYVVTVKVGRLEKLMGTGEYKHKRWENAYVPVVPLTPELNARRARGEDVRENILPAAIRVIVLTGQVRNDADIDRVLGKNELRGTVVNSVRSLNSETERLLRESYPATDFSKVILLQHARRPSGAGLSLALVLLGTLLCVAGGLLMIVHYAYRSG